MKKKIFFAFISMFILISIYKAAINNTYSKTVEYANKYIEIYKDNQKYIERNGNGFIIPYNFDNGKLSVISSFTRGGLLSKSEFERTLINNESYLSFGEEYWTLTSRDSSNNYYISHKGVDIKSLYDTTGTRVSEYVLPNTKVTGNGSKMNPWMFIVKYKITVQNRTPDYGNVRLDYEYVSAGDSAVITLEPKENYTYDTDTCVGIDGYSREGNIVTINNIQKDITCAFSFKEKIVKVTYDSNGGSLCNPNVITYKATDNYNLSCTPTRNGFNFDGWYSMREAGSKLTTSSKLITSNDHTVYAHWSAKPITLSNQNFTFTYSSVKQSSRMTNATGGSGLYTYNISGSGASNFSISNNNLFVNGGTNTGTYRLTIKATDNISGATTTATFSVTIRNTTTTTRRKITTEYIPDPTTRRTTTFRTTTTTTTKKVTNPKPGGNTGGGNTGGGKVTTTTTPTRKPITSRQKPSGCTCSGGSGCVGGISCPGSPVSNRSDCCR